MQTFPQQFNKFAYLDWHNTIADPGRNLATDLENLLNDLKTSQRTRLTNLAELLSRIHTFHLLSKKSRKEDISDADTEILLAEALKSDKYDTLFKSVDSIIDKLWRKNQCRGAGNYVLIGNLKDELSDLIRTSVVTSTFPYAENLTHSIELWKELVPQLKLNEPDYLDIEHIGAQQEAKMQNGYFAYHLDVKYRDGIRIEIQIYSRLSQIWRHLSHKLYEKVRLGGDVSWGHGTAASRLVSLGHLLHLAECEVEYLKQSIR